MIRKIVAFLLITCVLGANLGNSLIYAGFDLNQKYIASAMCENKDKPEMHCNGKCYLAKKVKQAEEKEKNQEQQSQKNRFQEALIGQEFKIDFSFIVRKRILPADQAFDLPKSSFSIFHPPRYRS